MRSQLFRFALIRSKFIPDKHVCRVLIPQQIAVAGPSAPRSRCISTRAWRRRRADRVLISLTSMTLAAGLVYVFYEIDQITAKQHQIPEDETQNPAEDFNAEIRSPKRYSATGDGAFETFSNTPTGKEEDEGGDRQAWTAFSRRFANFSSLTNIEWSSLADSIKDFIVPEWAKDLPGYVNKLQRELSMAPGSLADEIWQEAHDPLINPEIRRSAQVRVSQELCDEEKEFLSRRQKFTTSALAKYLDLQEDDINPEDVPVIAMAASGGGLRALVAGTGSLLATAEDGLFDCVTYTAGVSGSCWSQALFYSSIGGRRLDKMIEHLKARIGVHIAYPPVALASLISAPTNKFLLSGFVEKLKGDPECDFGLVDAYGLLLGARLLVPKGELGVDDRDLKISNQREYIEHGEHPLPIYTCVRHEIPVSEVAAEENLDTTSQSQSIKEKAKKEAWFQWVEISPFETFCEEFGAGIPTWALGRKFENGQDLPYDETNLRIPELRLTLLLGVFGSAFCATLSHYYKEIRPIVKGLSGFGGIDDLITGQNEDLSKIHPIDPASIPNFVYKMEGRLPETTPESIYTASHLQLMDAGMSNNLPIYPLLRPGRNVDILITFDASADVKVDNWLSVADGYARQRGIKGWPIGVGWPKESDTAEKTAGQLDSARASSASEAESKVQEAKDKQLRIGENSTAPANDSALGSKDDGTSPGIGDLSYCTIWVGTTEERSSSTKDVYSKAVQEDWELMAPDAGIAVVYFPFLPNPKVNGVDPLTSEYMSTWNFVYSPEDIDHVVALARANYDEGRERTRRCVRAVYERKRRLREEREQLERLQRWRRKVRLGIVGKKGEGDHFS